MHDGSGGFYPDLEHVVQSAVDDDPTRPCPGYPALLKDPPASRAQPPLPGAEPHCCPMSYPGELGLYWDGGGSLSRAG